jgi:integrase
MFRTRIPRQERARTRAAVGSLKSALVKPGTLKAYENSLRLFYLWLTFWSLSWPSDRDELDMLVSQFAEAAWEEGESRSLFACLVAGISYLVPSLRNSLFGARRLITAWDKSEAVARSFPIMEEMAWALAGSALTRCWHLVAFAVVIGYSGMLRLMELLSLKAGAITGSLADASVTLVLENTKTSDKKQITEKVVIREPMAAAALFLLADGKLPGDLLFEGLTPKTLRTSLRQLSEALGLQELLITPHSFRRGKATARFRESGSFHVVADEGRWESLRTCRKYVDCAAREVASYAVDRAKLKPAVDCLKAFFRVS